MERRHFLATSALALSTSLIGCTEDSTPQATTDDLPETSTAGSESTGQDQSVTKAPQQDLTQSNNCDFVNHDDSAVEPAQDGFPQLAVEGDELPADHNSGLATNVRMTRQYSADAPAQIEIAVKNVDDRPQRFRDGDSLPFSESSSDRTESPTAFLVPDGGYAGIDPIGDGGHLPDAPGEPVAGCWQIEGVSRLEPQLEVELKPCEVLRESYSVFAAAENEGCLPAGEYRFESHWGLPDSDTDGVTWGFTLLVTEPDGT